MTSRTLQPKVLLSRIHRAKPKSDTKVSSSVRMKKTEELFVHGLALVKMPNVKSCKR